jgi:hypothetical protein
MDALEIGGLLKKAWSMGLAADEACFFKSDDYHYYLEDTFMSL